MTKWEYKLLHFRAGLWTSSMLPPELNERFDELGAEGWEYVEMRPIQGAGVFIWLVGFFSGTTRFVAVFRRELE